MERRIRFGSMIRSHTGRKPGCKLLSVMPPAAAENERFPPPFVQNPFGYMPAGCRFWYFMQITTAISKVSGRVIYWHSPWVLSQACIRSGFSMEYR